MVNKINYDLEYSKIIKSNCNQPKLLLHACCAPCSSAVLNRVCKDFDVTVLFYNPNIYPQDEYVKRKNEMLKLCRLLNVKVMDCDYNEQEFLSGVVGLENQPEGGLRCNKCFFVRLDYTAKLGKNNNFDFFGTTLTISPHKNEQIINKIGKELQEQYNIKFLFADFKKQNGYLQSIKYSKEYNLYRQNYCGCRFSLNNKKESN